MNVGPGGRRGNDRPGTGARRRSRTVWLRAAAALLLAGGSGGCSLSFPIGGFKAEEVATGSIDRSAALLSSGLDGEDWRRARAALAVTLDPQGNGARAIWNNPQSGAHGSFTALGPPFPDQDRVCRRFSGEVAVASKADRHLSGWACRDGAGEWALRDAEPARAS